ncbi:MAG: hypothetical protein RLZZ165_1465 [Bacteroidota bacterium]|jgi:ribosome-binding protein aMBF1 (putative translation factor)
METRKPLQPKLKQEAEGFQGKHASKEGLSAEKAALYSAGRPEIVARKKLQEGINNSPQVQQLRALQEAANNSPQVKAAARLQRIATAENAAAAQRKQQETVQGDGRAGTAQLHGKNMQEYKPIRISGQTSKKIQSARMSKGMTQRDLAIAIFESLATVQTYENGSAIPSEKILQKMSKSLGVDLRR